MRQLVESFAAAIAEGQRFGTPIEYSEMVKQHYHGEGSGLLDSIQRFRKASNPLMPSMMRDAMAQLFADKRQRRARLSHDDNDRSTDAPTGRRDRDRERTSTATVTSHAAPKSSTGTATDTSTSASPSTDASSTSGTPTAATVRASAAVPSMDDDEHAAVVEHTTEPHTRRHCPSTAGGPIPTRTTQAQHAKAGMLPPNQQPRPPPLPAPHAPNSSSSGTLGDFEICGFASKKSNPFAAQFGRSIRAEMSRLYDEDHSPDQTSAKAQCRPIVAAIRRASGGPKIRDKWITTGRCKIRECKNAHPDWPVEWNGEWLHQQCPDLAIFAKVPRTWQPTWHETTVRVDGGHLGPQANQSKPLDTEVPTNAPPPSTSEAPPTQTKQQERNHP